MGNRAEADGKRMGNRRSQGWSFSNGRTRSRGWQTAGIRSEAGIRLEAGIRFEAGEREADNELIVGLTIELTIGLATR